VHDAVNDRFKDLFKVDSFFFGINVQKLSQMGLLDSHGLPLTDTEQDTKLSSEEHLFSRLRSSSFLRSAIFSKGHTLFNQGDLVEEAHIIFQGQVRVTSGETSFYMGPGAVIGLAEGIAQAPMPWTLRAETLLNTRIIPIQRAAEEIRNTDAGLRSICRVTVMRAIGMVNTPESLR
jgi:CRP-like cAMP-binding protein